MQLCAAGRDRGFTYLELLVVVGVIGVAAGVTIPVLQNAVGANRAAGGASLLASTVRDARLNAITHNARYRIVFDCPDGAVHALILTGVPAVDDAADRCTTRQPEDGLPVRLPADVSLGEQPPPPLEINSRGQVTSVGGGAMPQTIPVTYGPFTRALVVSATGRVTTPAH